MTVQLNVLGPLAIVADGSERPLGATRESALLSDLVVHLDEVVPAGRLIDDLWHEAPPPGAASTLQTYVRNLRRLLEPERLPGAPNRVLVSRGPGYLLHVDHDDIDARRFERLVHDGRDALAAGDAAAANDRLRKALALWRGTAFAEWSAEAHIQPEAARLEEIRVVALEDQVDARLTLGEHASLCGELERLVATHPYRERLWGQWMLALYRSGRQADALGAYQRLRRLLGDELGIEPGDAVRRLEEAILLQQRELDWSGRPTATVAGPAARGAGRLDDDLPFTTSFLGRDAELARLTDLLQGATRIITVTGPGGVGKTRLALHAARAVTGFDGTCLADLAPVTRPDAVAEAVLTALGGRRGAGGSALDALSDLTSARRLLVVLDNCEHVSDVAAACAAALARGGDSVVLATSRQPLSLAGEQVFPVRPLAVEAAVALFEDRAGAADPEFHLDGDDRDMAAAICRQLDALPLAIELAAARARTMTLAEIGRHLDSRFRLLRGELRGALNPHPSLLAAVQWSYDLLDPEAQLVFVRLSVFAGGFTADAVAAVCADRELDELGAIDVLDRLIGRSMVVVDRSRATARYSLLETLRQFGADRLATDSRQATVRTAHAAHYLLVAEEARHLQATSAGAVAVTVLDAEWDNFRVAFAWLTSSGGAHGVHGALRLVNTLRPFAAGTYRFELLSWAEQAVVLDGARQDPAWPSAAATLSLVRLRLGDLPGAETSALEAHQAHQAQLDRGGQPSVAPALAVFTVYWRWRTDLAHAVLPELEAAADATGDAIDRALVRYLRVTSDVQRGVDGSAALADAAVREAEETGSPYALATAHACVVAAQAGRDRPAAIDALRRVRHWAAIAGNRMIADNAALWVALAANDAAPPEALRFARDALRSSAETGIWGNLDLSLANVLLPLVEFGRFDTAARLLGGVIAHPLAMPQRDEIVQRTAAALTEALDARQCAELQAAGGRLTAAELAHLALTEIDDILGRPA